MITSASREHEQRVGHRDAARRRRRQPLDEPHDVVAEEADGAAPERAELGHVHRRASRARARRGRRADRPAGRAPCQPRSGVQSSTTPSRSRHAARGSRAQEGVARPRLAAGRRRLEQERERTLAQLGERRHRRVGVEQAVAPHRHDATARARVARNASKLIVRVRDSRALVRRVERRRPFAGCIACLLAAARRLRFVMVVARAARGERPGSGTTPRSRALVERATARRAQQLADTGLVDYKATAHGYLTFLAQVGEGLAEPPKVVKADELAIEVYWRAPNLSKQRIVGRRDTLLLPDRHRVPPRPPRHRPEQLPGHHPARRRRRGARRAASALRRRARGVRLRDHRLAALNLPGPHDRCCTR